MPPRPERCVCIAYFSQFKRFYGSIFVNISTSFSCGLTEAVACGAFLTLHLCLYVVLYDQLGGSIHLPVFQRSSDGVLPVRVTAHSLSKQPPSRLSKCTLWVSQISSEGTICRAPEGQFAAILDCVHLSRSHLLPNSVYKFIGALSFFCLIRRFTIVWSCLNDCSLFTFSI